MSVKMLLQFRVFACCAGFGLVLCNLIRPYFHSPRCREFLANLHGRAVLYTGAPGQVIKSLKNVSISLYPGESKHLLIVTFPIACMVNVCI